MDKSGAEAFVYAKACGMLAKSYVGERANVLFQAKSLSELWTLVFKTPSPLIPEVMLAEKIEEEAFNKFISEYVYFIDQFDHPAEFLSDQFFVYEVENLKEIVDSLCAGEKNCPKLFDLGNYTTLHTEKWPDIEKITEGTEYSWLKTLPDIHGQQEIEYRLDIQAVKHIWKSIHKTKGDAGKAVLKMFTDEFVIKNVLWAIRLKVNYEMTAEEIISKLMYVTEKPSSADPVCTLAIKTLEKNPENYADWEKWEYKEFLNPNESTLWKINPSWIERKARILQNKEAIKLFHTNPLASESLLGWYKIKQYELNCIRAAVESIRLNEPVAF